MDRSDFSSNGIGREVICVRQTPTMLGKRRRLVRQTRSVARRSGFTLIELMVVIGIMTVLVSIISASLVRVRMAAKSFVCKNQLKTVAFEFIQFADEYAHPWRGESDESGRAGFDLEDFQEHLYDVSEFSPVADENANYTTNYKAADHPLICPCGPQELAHQANREFDLPDAITPITNISIGFNLRLYLTDTALDQQRYITKNIVEHPTVPLAFDVDGEQAPTAATSLGTLFPFYSAPREDVSGPWDYWHPPMKRHGGHINAAFVGGHVLSSPDPAKQGGWDWKYQPPL